MKKKFFFFGIIIILIVFAISCFLFFLKISAQISSSNVTATVKISVCGNNIKEGGEQCDGTDLNGQTCSAQGFSGGILTCNPDCTFNTSHCTSGGGGGTSGGSGGGSSAVNSETSVTFSGRAYPQSVVTLLKDAQVAATTVADADADFSLTLKGLSGGNYMFSLYSEDYQGNRSSLLTFPVKVISGVNNKIEKIFIAPTISVDKSEVRQGENLAIFGQSKPDSNITIVVHSHNELFEKVKSDSNGVYLYNLDTTPLEMDQHFTKSRASLNGEMSSFSRAVKFIVGTKTVFAQSNRCPLKGDLNGDCRVNLVDFSIAAYWYRKQLSPEFMQKENKYLSNDNKVDLIDFSIMAFYWTG